MAKRKMLVAICSRVTEWYEFETNKTDNEVVEDFYEQHCAGTTISAGSESEEWSVQSFEEIKQDAS